MVYVTLWWTNIAIENGNSGFSHQKWWISIAMLVHQRVVITIVNWVYTATFKWVRPHCRDFLSGTHKIKKHPVRLVSKKGRAFSHFLSWNRKRPETATGGFHTHGTLLLDGWTRALPAILDVLEGPASGSELYSTCDPWRMTLQALGSLGRTVFPCSLLFTDTQKDDSDTQKLLDIDVWSSRALIEMLAAQFYVYPLVI